MKYIIIGATAILAGIMLFGMTWIAAAIYTTREGVNGRFADAISAIGYFPIFISLILVITGICFFVISFNRHLEDK
ncbi:hypothetical protein [Psychrobacillus antarcticus]|uniref:hypothetical protein n=1 Tax=Psychrobacillus antarcticus TaxID=2879115 RepID=UPI0024085395|nr:hypothetical protein [Psychrobacillus antarcticus]